MASSTPGWARVPPGTGTSLSVTQRLPAMPLPVIMLPIGQLPWTMLVPTKKLTHWRFLTELCMPEPETGPAKETFSDVFLPAEERGALVRVQRIGRERRWRWRRLCIQRRLLGAFLRRRGRSY